MVCVNCETSKGGAVQLNEDHGVWCSYAVATAGDAPPPELFYSGITLPTGQTLQFFVNRSTGLVVVDVISANGNSGAEILRRNVN